MTLSTSMRSAVVRFLIIGVQKGGTTSLARYLAQHPEIYIPEKKEIHFFDGDSDGKPYCPVDYNMYHSWFSGSGKRFCGEATPNYIYWKPALQRIKEYNQDMRIIVLLRNPIIRAWSHWKMQYSRRVETLGFELAIERELTALAAQKSFLNRRFSYIERGFYRSQLERIWELFPASRVLFLKSEEFFLNPASSLEKVLTFCELPLRTFDTSVVYNQGFDFGPMPRSVISSLVQLYADDVQFIESSLGWDCGDWIASC